MTEIDPDAPPGDPDWPYASLFFFGFFGASTPAGRRLVWQTSAALVVLIVAAGVLRGFPPVLPRTVGMLAIPAAVASIFWAHARYLRSLDELGRMIQLRGFAFSYGAVMVLASAFLAFGLASPAEAAEVRTATFVALLVLVEPLRGLALVFLAKKYQ